MTMHFAEHETKIIQDEVDYSEVAYLPIESIVDSYEVKIEGGRKDLEEINNEIANVEAQLHLWRIRQLYREEIADIRVTNGVSMAEVTESEAERILLEELTKSLDLLVEKRNNIIALIEESRIIQIRHEEAIHRRLFTTATSPYN